MTQSNYSRKEKGYTKITKQEWQLLAKKLEVAFEEIYEENETIYREERSISYLYLENNTVHIPIFVLNYIEMLQKENDMLRKENKG